MAAINSPTENPTARERPARSRYKAAESVAAAVKNRNRNISGPGRLVAMTEIHGAALSSRAIVASLVDSFAMDIPDLSVQHSVLKILAHEIPSRQSTRMQSDQLFGYLSV